MSQEAALHLMDLIGRMRNADLYCLVIMAIAHVHLGFDTVTAQWLRAHINFSQDAIADSLFKLSQWRLAEQPIRYHWRLTAAGHQLALPLMQSLTPLTAESLIHSPATTTEENINLLVESLPAPTPLTAESPRLQDGQVGGFTPPNRQAPGMTPGVQQFEFVDHTARLLAKLGGITYDQAREDIQAALAEGDTQQDIATQIKRWSAFMVSRGLVDGMGAAIARNIRNGDLCDEDL